MFNANCRMTATASKLCGLAAASMIAAAALPAAAEAKPLVADLRPVAGGGANAIVDVREDGTRLVATGLQPGSRYSLATSRRPCARLRRVRGIRMQLTMSGIVDAAGDAIGHIRGLTPAKRSFILESGGTIACGRLRPAAASFVLHPVDGHAVHGIVHVTQLKAGASEVPFGHTVFTARARRPRVRVHGIVAGAGGGFALATNAEPCTTSLVDIEGWDEVPLGVVNSEGWDEVPEDMMYRSSGVVDGTLRVAPGRTAAMAVFEPNNEPLWACSVAERAWVGVIFEK